MVRPLVRLRGRGRRIRAAAYALRGLGISQIAAGQGAAAHDSLTEAVNLRVRLGLPADFEQELLARLHRPHG